jgi:hypothetical protein
MREDLLHFIWQYQYFHKDKLQTTDGKPVHVLFQGYPNTDAGPDFLNSKIRIGEVEWIGNVELHVNSSNWEEHQHEQDEAYNSVILHVVFLNDVEVYRQDGTLVPALELKNRIFPEVIQRYRSFSQHEGIPCMSRFQEVSDMIKLSMLDLALSERLERKARSIVTEFERNNNDWEETCYQILVANFGFKLNNDPFRRLSKLLPYKLINKCSGNLLQIEALLFGMAGLLKGTFEDEYPRLLQKEFHYLSVKFSLQQKEMSGTEWKFLRVRPSGFPSRRIAQLAALLAGHQKLFFRFIESRTCKELYTLFNCNISPYWSSHYTFDMVSETKQQKLGKASVNSLIINSVVPLLAAYGKLKDQPELVDKAIELLETLPPEENYITQRWKKNALKLKSAFDTQAAIELYTHFCLKKQCLKCKIGINILKDTCISGASI